MEVSKSCRDFNNAIGVLQNITHVWREFTHIMILEGGGGGGVESLLIPD